MKKWIVGICVVVLLAVVVYALDYWFDFIHFGGEVELSQAFIDEFDLSKLNVQKVYEYVKDNERYYSKYAEDSCTLFIPEMEDYFMYKMWIREYEAEEPYYTLKWCFQLPHSRVHWADSVYFPAAERSFFSGKVHISATGGDVNMYVHGNSIEECRKKAEAYLLEMYYDLLKSNYQ